MTTKTESIDARLARSLGKLSAGEMQIVRRCKASGMPAYRIEEYVLANRGEYDGTL